MGWGAGRTLALGSRGLKDQDYKGCCRGSSSTNLKEVRGRLGKRKGWGGWCGHWEQHVGRESVGAEKKQWGEQWGGLPLPRISGI